MKKLNILKAIIVTFVLLSSIMLVSPAPASALGEEIVINPTQGEINQTITISGINFPHSTALLVYGAPIYLARDNVVTGSTIGTDVHTYKKLKILQVDEDGTFTGTFSSPSMLDDGDLDMGVSNGTYYIYATYYYQDAGTLLETELYVIKAKAEIIIRGGTITVNPTQGLVGSQVSISGVGFGASKAITIKFDNTQVPLSRTTNSSGSFSAGTYAVPAAAWGIHTITATDSSGLSTTSEYEVHQSMTLSKSSVRAGETVSVTGNGFTENSQVSITMDNEVVASAMTSLNGAFTANFTMPPKGQGYPTISATDSSSNQAVAQFTLAPASITVNPASGAPGTKVTISGSGFQSNRVGIPILFGNTTLNTTATTDANGTMNATFDVPAQAASDYKVRVSDGTSTCEATFTITMNATISPVTSAAAPGVVGQSLTIDGTGFIPNGTVNVTFDGSPVKSGVVGTNGTFSLAFNVPASKAGQHTIAASDGTATKQFTFVMESAAPQTPQPLKPEMGIKAKNDTFFDWQDVTDPSGVTYTLQVASDNTFAPNVIVLEKKGLTKSEYTITKAEQLKSTPKEKPYYWRIQAVDGASNASAWTTPGTFYLGGFPISLSLPKPVQYGLMGVGEVVLLLIAFWIGRRTSYY